MKTIRPRTHQTISAGLLLSLASTPPARAADLNVPAAYVTIQAAVDAAASGDTVRIAPGVYVEQIAITNKNLTLAGVPGAVIRASDALVPISQHHCTVYVLTIVQADVVVKGLSFEGEHLADGYTCSYGAVLFDGASGRVEDCVVRGFRRADSLYRNNGFGVSAVNADETEAPLNVQVLHCTFADNGLSIHVRGSDEPNDPVRLTFTIADNTITGVGLTTLGSQCGILISAGATGEVLRNTISDHSFNGTDDTSFGVFAVDWLYQYMTRASPIALHAVRYEGNVFRNNQLHLASALAHGSQFVNNTFEGSGVAARQGALALTGNTNQVIGNRFTDMEVGITLVGKDPINGTAYGLATNTRLLDNRFCNVTTNLVIQPLVTGTTNQGMLVCPFPPLELTIAPAVLLTWPDDPGGWVLESAALAAGPWAPADATPTLRDGQNSVTVRTDAEHRFFQLRKP